MQLDCKGLYLKNKMFGEKMSFDDFLGDIPGQCLYQQKTRENFTI